MSNLAEQITDLDVVFEYCLWGMRDVMENDDFEDLLSWARPCIEEFYDIELDEVVKESGMSLEEFETECRKRYLKDMVNEWKLQRRREQRGGSA
jgi:hypothetical protein